MKIAKLLVALLVSAGLISGCGGGAAPFQTPPTSTGSTVATITVSASSATIAADGSTTSTITGILRDKNQVAVSGAAVTFAANAGLLSGASTKSDASGSVTATLAASGAASGTVIQVTIASGTISGSTKVTVNQTTRTLTLTTNAAQIPSDGSKSATITALVVDANNQVIAGVPVQLSSSSGVLTPVAETNVTAGTTDANGTLTATLNAGTNQTNRTITVTGSLSSGAPVTVPVSVTGTTVALTGSANVVFGSPGTYTAQVRDASGNGIANQAVTFASANGNTLSATVVNTNSTGQATVTMTATKAGNDTVSATALGISQTLAVTVSAQNFAFTTPAPPPAAATQVDINPTTSVSVKWSNAGAPVSGQTVTFATTRGSFTGSTTATTDSTGVATATLSSASAGLATVTATGTGVTAATDIDFVATTPATLVLQPSATTVPAQGTATIVAVVRDANFNLVEGKTVDFNLTDVTGGQLSVPSAVTDSQGRAQTTYTAGPTSSATQGVTIAATVEGFPAASSSTTLTVGGQAVFLSLGTNNLLDGSAAAEYAQAWVVRALDLSGHSIPSQALTVAINSVAYLKGQFTAPPSTSTDTTHWYPNVTATCPSEDLNNNGILDPGEDVNHNGKLDPGLVASPIPGAGVTDSTGAFNFLVKYPKSVCDQVKIELSVTAVVNGTQSTTSTSYVVPCLATDVLIASGPPPGGVNFQYGQVGSCTDPN